MNLSNLVNKNHPKTVFALLTSRWLAHIAIGHPWLTPALAITIAVNPIAGIAIGAATEAALTFKAPQQLVAWRTAWSFRRRWPAMWAASQTRQAQIGPLRPLGISPKLPLLTTDGVYPKTSAVAAMFAVKPAAGQTLEQLEATADNVAAQMTQIERVQIEYDTTTQTTGRMTVTFGKVFEQIQEPSWL